MEWARILAYITGTVDQELLLRNVPRDNQDENFSPRLSLYSNEYLAAENRIFRSYDMRTLDNSAMYVYNRADRSEPGLHPRPVATWSGVFAAQAATLPAAPGFSSAVVCSQQARFRFAGSLHIRFDLAGGV
jgi:hypothetical protein